MDKLPREKPNAALSGEQAQDQNIHLECGYNMVVQSDIEPYVTSLNEAHKYPCTRVTAEPEFICIQNIIFTLVYVV